MSQEFVSFLMTRFAGWFYLVNIERKYLRWKGTRPMPFGPD
jgi:hypothetical protein